MRIRKAGVESELVTVIVPQRDSASTTVLVDAMTTVAEAEAVADWVALHNRNLETIYITQAQDHVARDDRVDRLQQTTASDEELFNQMTELYPQLGSQPVVVDVRIAAATSHINR